ncbi:hypothetical protein MRX96_019698 [Rhipicephalus microplus]
MVRKVLADYCYSRAMHFPKMVHGEKSTTGGRRYYHMRQHLSCCMGNETVQCKGFRKRIRRGHYQRVRPNCSKFLAELRTIVSHSGAEDALWETPLMNLTFHLL